VYRRLVKFSFCLLARLVSFTFGGGFVLVAYGFEGNSSLPACNLICITGGGIRRTVTQQQPGTTRNKKTKQEKVKYPKTTGREEK
jgi:hypothetical protein